MTSSDFLPLSPLLIPAAAAVLILLATCVRRNGSIAAMLTTAALVAAMAMVVLASRKVLEMPYLITPLLWVDGLTLFFLMLVLAAGLATAMMVRSYRPAGGEPADEMYVLLLLATVGAGVLVCSCHFASFFLGLELLSVSLYAMIAYRRDALGVEAGVKYLVLAATATAFLLMGMALVYSQTGDMSFFSTAAMKQSAGLNKALGLVGLAMILVGAGFKLALVPFHLWTPDVYQAAPAPVTAFVATASKGAMFALALRFFHMMNFREDAALVTMFAAVAVASMIAGNALALFQRNVKRMLAYSSIAHLGYLMVALAASGAASPVSACFYLAAYFAAMLGALAVVTALSGSREADSLDDYRGLAYRRPGVAAAMTAMLLSLAGIPLTAGFAGKFLVLWAGVGSQLWLLSIVLVVTSAAGLFYYLRIVATMFWRESGEVAAPAGDESRVPVPAAAVMAAMFLALLAMGVYPSPLLGLIEKLLQ